MDLGDIFALGLRFKLYNRKQIQINDAMRFRSVFNINVSLWLKIKWIPSDGCHFILRFNTFSISFVLFKMLRKYSS